MARNYKLTWQKGSGRRNGRWKKKYKGKTYYFEGGRGKTDREAYEAAQRTWDDLKGKIDQAAPRRHQVEYEAVLAEWEQVLAWSNRHGDRAMAERAFEKINTLRSRLAAPTLKALSDSDSFSSLFSIPVIQLPDELFANVKADLAEGQVKFNPMPINLDQNNARRIASSLDGSPTRIAQEVWNDRLKSQERRNATPEDSLQFHIEEYLRQKEQQVALKRLSAGRLYAIGLHLGHFRDWLGKETSIGDINGSDLMDYRSHALERVLSADKREKWTPTTARHYLTTVKAFVRWLWSMEAIPALPRILRGKSDFLNLGETSAEIRVFTKDQLHALLRLAPERTQLYLLLMLNCGMTQKDISDLKQHEVDWDVGRIKRKRSKTADHENVPTVNYLLWPETFRLLSAERSKSSNGRVLLNSNGSPLCTVTTGANGKHQKTDNVKNAYDRLKAKVGITTPLKSLKKTSASLLCDNERFRGLESLFLGHATKTVSERHYAQAPEKSLDAAISWLRDHYEIEEVVS